MWRSRIELLFAGFRVSVLQHEKVLEMDGVIDGCCTMYLIPLSCALKIIKRNFNVIVFCCCSVTKSHPTLCDHKARLPSLTLSWTVSKFMSTESVTPSNHLILCHLFSFCSPSFPASGSLPMSWLFGCCILPQLKKKTLECWTKSKRSILNDYGLG